MKKWFKQTDPEKQHFALLHWRQNLLIVCLGFFAAGSQPLLFRVFMRVFEGTELAAGCFFASWLFWILIGACVSRYASSFLLRKFELLPLFYIPAFVLQYLLILKSREIIGLEAYEIFPLAVMALTCFIFSMPVSVCTGSLFVLGCQWKNLRDHLPVARIYILETLGSFFGGIIVTFFLALRFSSETVFLLEALVLTVAVLVVAGKRQKWLPRILFVAVLLALVAGIGGKWAHWNNEYIWNRLLPKAKYEGAFTTSQAVYSYGRRNDQFLVTAWQSISESFPSSEHASEVAALHLAQHPDAEKIVVVGPGTYEICRMLLKTPRITELIWIQPDPDYASHLLQVLPSQYRIEDSRFQYVSGQTVRRFLESHPQHFDLAVLAIGSGATFSASTYRSIEFLRLVERSLASGGVAGISLPGAENFMDDVLSRLGAAQLQTLQNVFDNVVFKPGTDTWFFASDGESVTDAPAQLAQRLRQIPNVAEFFPPEVMLSAFPADRILLQKQNYMKSIRNVQEEDALITDAKPISLYYLMQISAAQSSAAEFAVFLKILDDSVLKLAITAALLVIVLRLLYRHSGRVNKKKLYRSSSSFDIWAMAGTVAFVNMSLSILLMVRLQAHVGTLFLLVGLVSSIFMFGLFFGSRISVAAMRAGWSGRGMLLICLLLHAVLLLAIPHIEDHSLWTYALLFFGSGFIGGGYVPVVVQMATGTGAEVGTIGSWFEAIDHLGGAFGALLIGMIILPTAGIATTSHFMLFLLMVPASLIFIPFGKSKAYQSNQSRALAYALTGIILFFAVARLLLQEQEDAADQDSAAGATALIADEQLKPSRARQIMALAEQCVGAAEFEPISVQDCFVLRVKQEEDTDAFFFATTDFADGVYGFNGPVNVGALVKSNGEIVQTWVLKSRETPVYFERVRGWLPSLAGHNISQLTSVNLDAVSGATVSATAVLRGLEKSWLVIQKDLPTANVPTDSRINDGENERRLRWSHFLLLAVVVAAFLLRWKPVRRLRIVFLVVTCLFIGWYLNLQYSTEQIRLLLRADFSLGRAALFLFVVPFLVLLVGNIYCGYLCPFGALQELLGEIVPSRWQLRPDKKTWRRLRAGKYWLLFIFAILLLLNSHSDVVELDPLVSFFSGRLSGYVSVVAAVALLFSLFIKRFWCRCLCPTGAFLALFNRSRIVRALDRKVLPAKCDLGVANAKAYDCICCDRCRAKGVPLLTGARKQFHNRLAFAAVGIMAVIIAYGITTALQESAGNLPSATAPRLLPSATGLAHEADENVRGKSRPVDSEKIKKLIDQRKLSDKPALFYEKASADDADE